MSLLAPSLALAIGCVLFTSCAQTNANRRLDDKLAAEAPIRPSDLYKQVGNLIESTPGLHEYQRSDLRRLQIRMSSQMSDINRYSLRLRYVLLKDLLSPQYDREEVELIKKRIMETESQRTEMLFEGVKQANEILRRSSPEMKDFWQIFLIQYSTY